MPSLTLTLSPDTGTFGADHLALQSAVDHVAARGGGTVRLRPGTYTLGNSLFLRNGVQVIGSGGRTVLRKCDAASTPLTAHADWYDECVEVADPNLFRPGGAIWVEGLSPFHQGRNQIAKRTVVAIDGRLVHLDQALRDDYWLEPGATASTCFSVVTGEGVHDAGLACLAIDGNAAANPQLDGNYAAGVFIQDCDRMTFRELHLHHCNSDGISAQICDDLVIDHCKVEDCAGLGLHPGSGCQRPRMVSNVVRRCSQGIFFCWGVRFGLAEANLIEDCRRYGVSIGHRDSDNCVRANTIRRSGEVGLLFRLDYGAGRSPDRCVVEDNVIEDSGGDAVSVGIDITGVAADLVIRNNRVVDSRPATATRRRVGVRIGSGAVRPAVTGNVCEGVEFALEDQRPAT